MAHRQGGTAVGVWWPAGCRSCEGSRPEFPASGQEHRRTGELVDLGVKAGIVEKSGAWFSYNSQRLGQGRENAKLFLRDNPDTAREIEMSLRQNAGLIADRFLENGGPDPNDSDDAAEA